MTKHGCFSCASEEVENSLKNATRQKPLGLLINVALAFTSALTTVTPIIIAGSMVFMSAGCANSAKERTRAEPRLSKEEVLERKLRRLQSRVETLRERNLILKSRIKIISRSGGAEPLRAKEDLNGFDSGVVLDVPIDARREPAAQSARVKSTGREEVLNKIDLRPESRRAESPRKMSPRPRRLPLKQVDSAPNASTQVLSTTADLVRGEQADRALVRTIVALLKEKEFAEAERTAMLLEKSYPDSPALAEAKFQIGLGYFRARTKVAGALQKADTFFASSLAHRSGHVRVKAGASLMRGIIAKRTGLSSGDHRNLEIATRNFDFVISTFPKTSEARRARAELSAINRRVK